MRSVLALVAAAQALIIGACAAQGSLIPASQEDSRCGAPLPAGGGASWPPLDNDETLWPDPVLRTEMRMINVRHRILTYETHRSELPRDLTVVLQDLPPVYGRDAWGNPFEYTSTGSGFVLSSAGPDGERGTTDDITVERGTSLPRTAPDRFVLTRGRMECLRLLICSFQAEHGAFPATVEELFPTDLQVGGRVLDAWGNRMSYTPALADFVLRSGGPDGQAGTGDDIALRRIGPPVVGPD